jgi:hypothetical protein
MIDPTEEDIAARRQEMSGPLEEVAGYIPEAFPMSASSMSNHPAPLMSAEAYRVVMHNARSIARGDIKRHPNWAFAMRLFSCGSTHGWVHCEHAEIDPDGYSVGEIYRHSKAEGGAA